MPKICPVTRKRQAKANDKLAYAITKGLSSATSDDSPATLESVNFKRTGLHKNVQGEILLRNSEVKNQSVEVGKLVSNASFH